jgi:hypothetical protein
MMVNIYVSENGSIRKRYGLAAAGRPISLPKNETWRYVRCADTAEFNLPEAIEEEIARRGYWAPGTVSPSRIRREFGPER